MELIWSCCWSIVGAGCCKDLLDLLLVLLLDVGFVVVLELLIWSCCCG